MDESLEITCPDCGSDELGKYGVYRSNPNALPKQQYKCKNCNRVFAPGVKQKVSVLEPYTQLIQNLLNHQYTYREIAQYLDEKHNVKVTRQRIHTYMNS